MSYRPFRNIGRFLLAACAVSLVTASLCAQTASAPSTTAVTGPNPSRIDVFMGYSYFGAHGQIKPYGIKYSSVDEGAILSGAYYFNKYAGMEVMGVANPNGQNDGFYSGYAGPIFRAPMQNFTLFAHGGAGGVRAAGPNSEVPATAEHEPWRWGVGVYAGGGMDYDLPFFNHMFGLRLFQADYRYIHADFNPGTGVVPTGGYLGGRANLSAAELSTGILMHFGHIIPPPPLMYSCAVTAPTGTIYPGDVVTVTGTVTNVLPKKTPAFTWAADGGAMVSGTENVASVDTKALSGGTYTVKGHVSDGNKPDRMADCTATFTVTPFSPPTVGCSANPSSVLIGGSSTITAAGMSPQNRPLTYSYTASAGQISGSTATTTLTTTGVAPGPITVTCSVVDDKGQKASQMTTVTVTSPPAVAPKASPVTKSLCTIGFDKDPKRPVRVDNEAKACLDDVTLNAQRDATSKLAIVGNSAVKPGRTKAVQDRNAAEAMKMAAERARNEKEYLVKEKRVDASRITLYTGTTKTNTDQTILIPAGATFDTTGLTPVKDLPKPAPRRHHAAPAKKPAAPAKKPTPAKPTTPAKK